MKIIGLFGDPSDEKPKKDNKKPPSSVPTNAQQTDDKVVISFRKNHMEKLLQLIKSIGKIRVSSVGNNYLFHIGNSTLTVIDNINACQVVLSETRNKKAVVSELLTNFACVLFDDVKTPVQIQTKDQIMEKMLWSNLQEMKQKIEPDSSIQKQRFEAWTKKKAYSNTDYSKAEKESAFYIQSERDGIASLGINKTCPNWLFGLVDELHEFEIGFLNGTFSINAKDMTINIKEFKNYCNLSILGKSIAKLGAAELYKKILNSFLDKDLYSIRIQANSKMKKALWKTLHIKHEIVPINDADKALFKKLQQIQSQQSGKILFMENKQSSDNQNSTGYSQ
ncbi:MAG: hypothetical protein COB50_02305 [Thiotrichales bacterium]|nr:MAG: hypothetical protein COB50_02305 [Thiotrichales bacterium]